MRPLPSRQLIDAMQKVQDEHIHRDSRVVRDALAALSGVERPRPDPKTVGATVRWSSDPEVIAAFCDLAKKYAKTPDTRSDEKKPLVAAPDPFAKSLDAGIGQRLFYIGDANGRFCAGMLVGAPWTSPVPIPSLRLFERYDDLAYRTLCSGRFAYGSTFVADASLGVKGLIPLAYERLKAELDDDVALVAYAQIAREREVVGTQRTGSSATIAALMGHQRAGFVRAGWGSTFTRTPGLVSRRSGEKAAIPEPILFSLAICPSKKDRHLWPKEAELAPAQADSVAWKEAVDHPWRPFDTQRVWALSDACFAPQRAEDVATRQEKMRDMWSLAPPFPVVFPNELGSHRLPMASTRRLLDIRIEQLKAQHARFQSALDSDDEQSIVSAMNSLVGGAQAAQAVYQAPDAPNLKQAQRACVSQKVNAIERMQRGTEAALKTFVSDQEDDPSA